jgi:uracil phosphoribosyltransferase
MSFQLVEHPLIANALHHLRDAATPSSLFKHYCHLVSVPVILEATRFLKLKQNSTRTPLETTKTETIAQMPVWIPILRAGLGMLKVAQDLFPESEVGHIGLERDESTAIARTYYHKLPSMNGKAVVILDPMLATGGSAIHAIDYIKAAAKEQGIATLALACIVAAPEGVKAVQKAHPDVAIVSASLDRELNDRKYILPGLGDFGDRYFHSV